MPYTSVLTKVGYKKKTTTLDQYCVFVNLKETYVNPPLTKHQVKEK